MKARAIVTSAVGLLIVLGGRAAADNIVSFPASDFSSNIGLMDQTLGVAGYTIEGFESTTLIPGLSIALTNFNNGQADETLTSLPQLYSVATDGSLTSENQWDGTDAFNNTPNNGSIASYGGNPPVADQVTFSFAGGATSVGIGLSNFQSLSSPIFPITDHSLYINGIEQSATLESIVGSNWTPGLVRNAYIRIDTAPGQTIDSIGFGNIAANSDDFLIFDHLAVQSVPEPSTMIMAGTAAFAALAYRRSRYGRSSTPPGGRPRV